MNKEQFTEVLQVIRKGFLIQDTDIDTQLVDMREKLKADVQGKDVFSSNEERSHTALIVNLLKERQNKIRISEARRQQENAPMTSDGIVDSIIDDIHNNVNNDADYDVKDIDADIEKLSVKKASFITQCDNRKFKYLQGNPALLSAATNTKASTIDEQINCVIAEDIAKRVTDNNEIIALKEKLSQEQVNVVSNDTEISVSNEDLPDEVIITIDEDVDFDDNEELSDCICEHLGDEYGFLVASFGVDVISEEKRQVKAWGIEWDTSNDYGM